MALLAVSVINGLTGLENPETRTFEPLTHKFKRLVLSITYQF